MFRIVPFGCLPLLLVVAFAILFPVFLADAMTAALAKLGLSAGASLAVVIAMFIGGLFNIPLKRVPRVMSVDTEPPGLYGAGRIFPQWFRRPSSTVIAVNVGGCVVPCMLVAYELARIAERGPAALGITAAAAAINAALCFRLARPVPNVGVVLPPLVPALAAAACGFLFMREFAPPVAFTAGVLGPLVGADLLNLRRIAHGGAGIVSIGGAGTFDGIVLSGLFATLLS